MSDFVLDENVVWGALRFGRSGTQADRPCIELVETILRVCHRTRYDALLLSKYSKRLDEAAPVVVPQVRLAVTLVLFHATKFEPQWDPPPAIPNEEAIPRKDVSLARLAAATRAHLVTTDGPLLESLAGRSDVRAVRPAEALPLAQAPP